MPLSKGRQEFSHEWTSVPGSLDQFSRIRERASVSFLHQLHLTFARFGGEEWGCGSDATNYCFLFVFGFGFPFYSNLILDLLVEFTCRT